MNWKTFLLGTAAGFAAGYATKQLLDQSSKPSPDKVLAQVKETVKKDGNIYGSWILMKPENYTKTIWTMKCTKAGSPEIQRGNASNSNLLQMPRQERYWSLMLKMLETKKEGRQMTSSFVCLLNASVSIRLVSPYPLHPI